MSGHSKWATIKHKKGAADKARGKLFAKLIRQVEVAAREGGGDVESNATLRTMFQKARDASVPTDTIERAIKRGTGELEGVRYEPMSYEGYAPCGVAVYVECLSDNRNRTGAEVRNLFTKNGGSVAEPGAVAWQFERKGVVIMGKRAPEDDVMLVALEAGAEDLKDQGDSLFQVFASFLESGALCISARKFFHERDVAFWNFYEHRGQLHRFLLLYPYRCGSLALFPPLSSAEVRCGVILSGPPSHPSTTSSRSISKVEPVVTRSPNATTARSFFP